MNKKNIIGILFSGFVLIFGLMFFQNCSRIKNSAGEERAGKGSFTDLGFIPSPLSAGNPSGAAEFHASIFQNGFLYIATTDGIWKIDIFKKVWSRSGLPGNIITALYKHPTISGKFFAGIKSDQSTTLKTLYISSDAGQNWMAVNPLFDTFNNRYEEYYSFAVRPNNPNHIFANLSGATIAVSTDGGINWTRMNNEPESFFGYQSNIVFLPSESNKIYQGSENPIDDAWLASYDLNLSNPVLMTNFTKIIEGMSGPFSNKRPTDLSTYSYTGDSIYIGQEGGLSKVTNGQIKFIMNASGKDENKFPYSYIYGVWVDPKNTNHIVFGGATNGAIDKMQLYETYDEGSSIVRLQETFGISLPEIVDIVDTNNGIAITINDSGSSRVKVISAKLMPEVLVLFQLLMLQHR